MYIKNNNELFYLVDKKDYYKIVTRKESKSDKTFYSRLNVFIKEIAIDDPDIRDIYDVDFFVIYFDESETIKKAAKYVYEGTGMLQPSQRAIKEGIWCVNEGRPLYRTPKIEDGEVGLWLHQQSCSDDWVMDDRCSCSKIVDLYDCSGYIVKYTYTVKDGVQLPKEEIVEVKMSAEDFRNEMLKYRIGNI